MQLNLRFENYLLMAAGYFLPVFPYCPISKQRYAYNGRNDIFDQSQPVGQKTDPLVKSNGESKSLWLHIPFGGRCLFGIDF